MAMVSSLRPELERIERRVLAWPRPPADRSSWDWLAESCPCGLPPGECAEHPRARAAQRPPGGDWRTWLILAGRGFGKTRTGAEWVRHLVESGAARRIALVGATAGDVRDVMVEGPSGILAVSPPWMMPRYEPSKRRLTWPGGAVATTFSAEEPNRLRGPNQDAAWADELAAWEHPAAWDMLRLGTRLGTRPQILVSTTPRPTGLLKAILAEPTTAKTGGSTYENARHLAPEFNTQNRDV
jgi:phage terminase large subunit-like protein